MPAVFNERWQALSEHLDRAIELTEPQRVEWLAALSQTDPQKAGLVADLLGAHKRDEFADFLEGASPIPVEEVAGTTLIGRRVGPYEIDAEIGCGGMGSVWRAHRVDGRYDSNVAVKFVHASWIGRSGEQRFRVEGNLLGHLNHANIARLIDAGVLDGAQPYLVLEYVQGEPIDMYRDRL